MPDIILKKSSVTAKTPLTSELSYGELALNYADGKLWYKNSSNVIKYITGYESRTGLYQWTYTGKSFSVNTQETAPLGVFFKPDGLKMYVTGNTGDDINEYDLSVAWDINTAVFLRVSATLGASFVTDLFFRADGLKVYVTNASNGTVYEYDLGTAWNVSTISAVRNVAFTAQETVINSIRFKSDGLKMFLCGSTNDRVHEYTLSTAWDISTTSFVQSLQLPTLAVESIDISSDGAILYVVTGNPYRVYQYNLPTPWSLSSAAVVSYVSSHIAESTVLGLFIQASENKAWFVGDTGNAIYEINTAGTSFYIDTNNNRILGDTEFDKNVIVNSSLYVNNNVDINGTLTITNIVSNSTFTGAGNFTLSNTASTISLGTSQTTGTILMGGGLQTGTITLGRSTSAQTLNIATGATLNATTKTVNLGTLGVSGSTTNINIGSAVSGALGTTLLSSPTVTVSNALTVGTINKLTLTQPANGATLTIGDGTTISLPQSLSFPNSAGTSGYVLSTDGAGTLSWVATTSGGTVTSVALAAPALFTVTGSPVTGSGTLTLSYSGSALPVANGGTALTTIAAKSILVANALDTYSTVTPSAGQSIRINAGNTAWESYTPSTVSNVSVVSTNGFAGTVADSGTTPAITISTTVTGVLKGNGTTISAATAGTDYVAPGTATTFTAAQSFTDSGILLKGSSTGYTTFSSANASATNYTVTFPASTGTVLTTAAAVTPAQGGTGQTTYTDGQLLIGNSTGNTLTKASLTAGSNITITPGPGSITIAATGGGSASWSRKTANYTAVSGDKLICDTSGGAFSITLPATPSIGNYVELTDGADWFTTNLTVLRNGSTIEGSADDVLLDIKGITVYFIYDGTTWQVTATLGKQGASGTGTVAEGGTGLTTIAALSIPVANVLDTYTTVTPAAGQSVRINAGGTAWEAYTPGAGGGSITVEDDTTTNATRYIVFEDVTSGTSSTIGVASTKLYFNPSTGTLNATLFNSLSDRSLKENIVSIHNATNTIKDISGVEFNWKDSGKKSAGIIAQDLESVLPWLVDTNLEGIKSVNYAGLTAYLIEVIKNFALRIEHLETNNAK